MKKNIIIKNICLTFVTLVLIGCGNKEISGGKFHETVSISVNTILISEKGSRYGDC